MSGRPHGAQTPTPTRLCAAIRCSQKLLKKVKSQADEADVAAPKLLDTERSNLMHIVGKYSMSSEDIEALITWRHADDH